MSGVNPARTERTIHMLSIVNCICENPAEGNLGEVKEVKSGQCGETLLDGRGGVKPEELEDK